MEQPVDLPVRGGAACSVASTMESDNLVERQAARQRTAGEILARLHLLERWAEVGVPKLVGAAAYGLMVAPDIDIEIYCDAPTVEAAFGVVSEVSKQPRVWRIRYADRLDSADQGLYWQLRYRADEGELWKVDMWLLAHDHPGPRAADLVEPMKHALRDDTRAAIVGIKEALFYEPDVHSIEIYEAVLDDGVRSADEFLAWRTQRERVGLTFWRPTAM